MRLLPQDFVVALEIALHEKPETYAQLAIKLEMSPSEAHQAVQRAQTARLLVEDSSGLRANKQGLLEFGIHGIRYAFPGVLGPEVRGMPTAHSAPVLRANFMQGGQAYVWPAPEGEARGLAIEPLHKGVPHASARDDELYRALALVDAIRVGRAREKQMAAQLLSEMLD